MFLKKANGLGPGRRVAGFVVLTMLAMVTLLAVPGGGQRVAHAQVDEPAPDGADPSACDAALGFEVLARGAEFPLGPDVSFNVSRPRRLAEPVGPGHVVVSGVVADSTHVPFDFDHQENEQIRVALLNRTGQLLATTAPTMDLADDETSAFFRLPSVVIDEPAHYIRVVHGGTPDSFNSVTAPCINLEVVEPDSPPADRWSESPCPAYLEVDRTARCGFLAVPERRDRADSRLIQVAAVILPTRGASSGSNFTGDSILTQPPLFYFEGGPGGPGSNVASILGLVAPFANERDLVIMDQRGTGLSMPNLSCDDDPGEADVAVLSAEVRRCQARLAREQVDLSGFTTAEAAADASELRQALGYRSWDLLGTSYGTTVAMTVMAQNPGSVRSVVLDSVLPPSVNFLADAPGARHRQFDDLVASCNIDESCREAFPRLRADLIRAVERVEQNPVPYPEHLHDLLGRTELDGLALVLSISRSLSDPNTPAVIHALATLPPAGQAEALASLFPTAAELDATADAEVPVSDEPLPPVTSRFSTGLYLSVICAEEVADPQPFLPEPATTWSPTLDRLFVEVGNPAALRQLCEIWDFEPQVVERQADMPLLASRARSIRAIRTGPLPVAPVPAVPVVADVPVLILSAQDDPQTPPAWVVPALDASTRSNLALFPQGGHVLIGNRCANEIIASFLDRPASPIDQSCLANEPRVIFATELPSR